MKHAIRKLSPQGDETVAEWDTETVTPQRLKAIEKEFRALTAQGYFAADITDNRNVLVKDFDPEADLLLIPKVQGG
jgi:hypothetical protein